MREYIKAWSPALGREMEMLRFGRDGLPLLAFPTSMGRFYEWEDFGLVGALADKIQAGLIQLWCVDSVDRESWLADHFPPEHRVAVHLAYERYIADELIPAMGVRPVTTGTSFGAYHAVLLALRRPTSVAGFVALSGAYDGSRWLDGRSDGEAYFVNPLAFVSGLHDEAVLGPIRGMEKKVIATGRDDPNVTDSVRVAELMNEKGVGAQLDLWDGWQHDWPYWKEMMRTYV